MTTPTKPGRRPSDYRPKASVIASQQQAAKAAAQKAELDRANEELSAASTADSTYIPVDENTLRKEQLIAAGIGSKKTGAKLTLLVVLFIGLVIGSIVMVFNNLVIAALITLVIAGVALLGLSLWIKSLYTALIREFGKEETIEILLSKAKSKK